MSLWTTALGWLGGGRLSNPDEGTQSDGQGSRATEADIVVTDRRALGVTAFWACVRLIVNSGATLPLPLYTRDAEGNRDQVDEANHYASLLHRQPNSYMNGREWRMALWAQRVIYGNAYAHIRRRGDGQVSSIMPLQPGAVTVYRDDDGVRFEYATTNGTQKYYNRNGKPREILHWRGWSTDGVIGFSPIDYARDMLGITVSADKYASKSFNGRPNAVMKSPTFLTDKQRQQVKALYEDMNGAGVFGGHNWLLEGGFDYKTVTETPDKLQMLESRRFQVVEVCRLFNVQSVLVDASEQSGSWPASYEKQMLAFRQNTLNPYLVEFEDKLRECILPAGMYAEHNVEGLLRADSTARANYYSQLVQNGILTRNEVRRKENMRPLDGLDEPTIQVNLTPAQDLGGAPTADTGAKHEKEPPVFNITMPEHTFNMDLDSINVRSMTLRDDMDIEREIVAYDEKGFPSKVIERKVKR